MKKFVLVRGESGILYLYKRETWEWMSAPAINTDELEFVTDNDDPEVLKQMQALVNKDMEGI